MADVALKAPLQYQQWLVRYRMGRFMWRTLCICDKQTHFRRGHEGCRSLPQGLQLSKIERRQKQLMQRRLVLDRSLCFTDIDFLLNLRQFERAGNALLMIRKALMQKYHERMLEEDSETNDTEPCVFLLDMLYLILTLAAPTSTLATSA